MYRAATSIHPYDPFRLLEITVISAQDLHPASRRMRAYAMVWIDPDCKLCTRTDPVGHKNPTWNDKFVFRIDDSFLRSDDTSAITVDIHSARGCLPSHHIGTARIVLSALHLSSATRFVALQVRRPSSLRPQGILNVGISLLQNRILRSMPLCYDPEASAFALKDLVAGGQALPRAASTGEDWQLDRCRSVELGSWAVERERAALESKLEMWRTELSPYWDRFADAARSRKRSSRTSWCFCGGGRKSD